jgi:hypothetical protein
MYLKCVDCEEDTNFQANYYRDAAMVCKNSDSEKYTQMVDKACVLFTLSGRDS